VKASLSASDHASCLVSSDLRSLEPIIEFTMKSVRRDEVARHYGVSEAVKNPLPSTSKNNLCLTIKIVLLNVTLNRVNETFGR